jgi:putative phage-type endonuclease
MRIKQRTDLWYTTRKRMITASDMAACLDVNPYSSRKQLFKKKTGQCRPFKGNFATQRGTLMEPVAIAAYERVSGNTVFPEDIGLLQHLDWPQIGGSPDGITTNGILIEIKCPLSRKIIPGFCPKYYVPQVQILMEICDLEEAHFVQYRPSTVYTDEVVDITVMKRDRGYFSRSLPVFVDFMEEVTEFYTKAQLPIGTPAMDWDIIDKNATKKKEEREFSGVGKICAFVDDPVTNVRKFVVEEYTGPDNPVIRTEHILLPEDTAPISEVIAANEAMASIAFDDRIELDIAAITARLPDRFKRCNKRKLDECHVTSEEEEEEEECITLDVNQILKRMKTNN